MAQGGSRGEDHAESNEGIKTQVKTFAQAETGLRRGGSPGGHERKKQYVLFMSSPYEPIDKLFFYYIFLCLHGSQLM